MYSIHCNLDCANCRHINYICNLHIRYILHTVTWYCSKVHFRKVCSSFLSKLLPAFTEHSVACSCRWWWQRFCQRERAVSELWTRARGQIFCHPAEARPGEERVHRLAGHRRHSSRYSDWNGWFDVTVRVAQKSIMTFDSLPLKEWSCCVSCFDVTNIHIEQD